MYNREPKDLEIKLTINVLVSSNSHFHLFLHMVKVMYVLVRVCIWVIGFYNLEVLGTLMGFLELRPPVCG